MTSSSDCNITVSYTQLDVYKRQSLNGRLEKQIATAYSLGLKKIGQTTEQPDNAASRGKIKTIIHLIEVTE